MGKKRTLIIVVVVLLVLGLVTYWFVKKGSTVSAPAPMPVITEPAPKVPIQ
jgi:flagellar basal body-associated protein FliL